MKPLWFLTCRSFVNGVKRALSSPRRLIGLLFFTGYYFMFFIRPALMNGRGFSGLPPGAPVGKLEFPPLEIIDAFAFGILALMSLFMMLGVMAQQTGFKPADVDVLFPTPVPPRAVLLFRMLRDYIFTLILPFAIVLFGLRPVKMGWEAVFRNFPDSAYSGMTFKALTLSWFLMSMSWIAITYAISLFINRSDRQSTRNKRILAWSISLITIGTFAYIVFESRQMTDAKQILELAQSPVLRTVFFTATFATQLTMAPLTGDVFGGLLGAGALLSLVGGALWVAMSQAGWMYDQAAVKGFESVGIRAAQRRGDTMGAIAELARRGKIRAGRQTWVHRLRMQGAWALMWKEFFIQTRGMIGMLVMLSLMGIAFCMLPALVPNRDNELGLAPMYFIMQAVSLFMITLALAQTGFIEVLRRVDLQKPLPFAPPTIVFFEICAKSLLGIFVGVTGGIVAVILNPSLWPFVLASFIYTPALSLLLSSTVFLVTIMFPDFEDPTQRQFRGLMMLLALAVLGLPPTAVFLGLWFVHVPVWLAALSGAMICLGVSLLACVFSGRLYETYNPSE